MKNARNIFLEKFNEQTKPTNLPNKASNKTPSIEIRTIPRLKKPHYSTWDLPESWLTGNPRQSRSAGGLCVLYTSSAAPRTAQ